MSKNYNFSAMSNDELKETRRSIQSAITNMKHVENFDAQLDALEACMAELQERGIKENE